MRIWKSMTVDELKESVLVHLRSLTVSAGLEIWDRIPFEIREGVVFVDASRPERKHSWGEFRRGSFDKVKLDMGTNPRLAAFIEGQFRNLQTAIEKSEDDPMPLSSFWNTNQPVYQAVTSLWVFKGDVYIVERSTRETRHTVEETQLLILEYYDQERQKFESLKRRYRSETIQQEAHRRERIPEEVRIAVWRRDSGKCSRCGSRDNLEYDHIVPVSMGGSNTARNIELLCEKCNRAKSNHIE